MDGGSRGWGAKLPTLGVLAFRLGWHDNCRGAGDAGDSSTERRPGEVGGLDVESGLAVTTTPAVRVVVEGTLKG